MGQHKRAVKLSSRFLLYSNKKVGIICLIHKNGANAGTCQESLAQQTPHVSSINKKAAQRYRLSGFFVNYFQMAVD
jgi:hypothetical protein